MKSSRRSYIATKSLSSSCGSHLSSPSPPPPSSPSWAHLRSVLFVVTSLKSASSSDRDHKSPWSRKRKERALSPNRWRRFFTPDGKLCDGGVKLLKKVRNGGIDPSIRQEVWPFLLGVYDLESSRERRDAIRDTLRQEYKKLRRHCRQLLKQNGQSVEVNMDTAGGGDHIPDAGSPVSEETVGAQESLSTPHSSEKESPRSDYSDNPSTILLKTAGCSRRVPCIDPSVINTDSSDSDFFEEEQVLVHGKEGDEVIQAFPFMEPEESDDPFAPFKVEPSFRKDINCLSFCCPENFASWRRIIRLDALRANADWMPYSPPSAAVSGERAFCYAKSIGLKDYDHLEPQRIFHAARLVAILEAYAVYDPEIGYCQGMSDLLSPIIAVVEEDYLAFWCFVGFMKKARHNFRLDETGIRRQLNIVSKIIRIKDSHLYRHLVKVQAEDCFFLYRMVVVLFRRELNFVQTLCLWEVMWADQAAVRAGIGKSAWSRIRQRAPPTEDLLLFAIAAVVLERSKQIIEKYSSMDEILRECNNMCGQLDVWKLLDSAHDLVIALHNKIRTLHVMSPAA